ncbi:MAG: hypothetical protein ACLQRM_20315 [Acidimicrobiales bacterium]|jgi:hypothetical protein
MTVLVVLPLWLLHPLVQASVIASTARAPLHKSWVTDSVVNTGILPVSFRAAGGRAVEVSSTGIGQVSGPLHAHGLLSLKEAVTLPWWGLVIVALAVTSPLLRCLWHIFRGDEAAALHARDGSVPPTP